MQDAALRLLAMREHSRAELRRKLRSRAIAIDEGGGIETLERVLDALVEGRELSDARFTEAFVASRIRKGQGPMRIRAGLRERGVEALSDDEGDEVWMARLIETARRRFGDEPAVDAKEQARRARFLEYRGFPVHLIRRYLRGR